MSELKGCDTVLAISSEVISFQFEQLFNRGIIHQKWMIVQSGDSVKVYEQLADFQKEIDSQNFDYALEAELGSPIVSLDQNERKILILTIQINNGTFHYWKGHGPNSKIEKIVINDLQYGFKVQIGSVNKDSKNVDWITEESKARFQQILKDRGLPDELFTIEQLFLDFENANFTDYDATHTHVNVTFGINELATFQNVLSNYFKTLKGSSNPYILGYAPKLREIQYKFGEKSVLQPTSLKYSTSYDEAPEFRSLNFLMMTDKKDFPAREDLGLLEKSLVRLRSDNTVDGVFAIDRKLFVDKCIRPIVEGPIAKGIQNIFDKIESKSDTQYNVVEQHASVSVSAKIEFSKVDDLFKSNVANISIYFSRSVEPTEGAPGLDKDLTAKIGYSFTVELDQGDILLKIYSRYVYKWEDNDLFHWGTTWNEEKSSFESDGGQPASVRFSLKIDDNKIKVNSASHAEGRVVIVESKTDDKDLEQEIFDKVNASKVDFLSDMLTKISENKVVGSDGVESAITNIVSGGATSFIMPLSKIYDFKTFRPDPDNKSAGSILLDIFYKNS